MRLTMREIFEQHHVDKRYLEKNYRAALLNLENEKMIETNRGERKPREGTFPPDMIVRFAQKGRG